MSKIPDVPSTENVPDGPLAWLKNWLDQVRLWVQTRDPRATRVGDPLDKFTDRRELVDLGILRRSSDGTFRPGTGFGGGATIVIPGGDSGGSGPDFSDLAPPPAPSGLTAEGGIFTLQLAWDAPIYTQGRGNGQTNIYGAVWLPGTSKPTLGDPRTKRIDSAMETSSLHAYPTQPATRWVVWIKFQTRNGVEGPPSLSAEATTGQDVSALLTIITGQIRESHLYRALGDPIRSIIERSDAAAADTVAALVAAHESGRRARTALLAEAAARGTGISDVRRVVADGDAQLASQITTLTATVDTERGDRIAAVSLEADARADGDAAEAGERAVLATQLRGGYTGTDLASVTSGLVFSERQARAAVDSAHADRLDLLESSVDNPATGLLARASVLEARTTDVTSGNTALATRATSLESSVNTPGAGLLSRASALEAVTTDASSGNGALATRTSTVEARVNTPSATPGNPAYNPTWAAVQVETNARAQLDNAVQALYTVRAQVSAGGRTLAGGFGLAGTATAAEGPRITFGVIANEFYVGAPDDGSAPDIADVLPFIIQATPTTINGVAVPAGTYIADAFIRNGTITNVKIANAAIDDAKVASLSAAKLTAGSIAVGAYIQATNYVSGTSGWRISGNGTAEFSGVIVRGTIIATAGSIGGNTIDSTGVQSPGYTAGSTGWRLDTSGLVRAFASGGARVLDMAATGAAPVLKIGSALELLANGNAYFGGQLAVGAVSANGSTTSSASFPSLPNSTSTFSTGAIAFSPAASITGVGGNISAWVSCDVRVAAESTAVEAIRVFAYLYRNGAQVDSSEVFLRACAFPDATGATRTVAAEVTLLSPLEPLTGAQVFTLGFDVKFYNAAGAVVSPGPTAFTSYLQVISRANLQEIKV